MARRFRPARRARVVKGEEEALELCKQSANMPHTTPHHNERADRRKSGGLRPDSRLHDTPRHSEGGLVNRGSAVRVRRPAWPKLPVNMPVSGWAADRESKAAP